MCSDQRNGMTTNPPGSRKLLLRSLCMACLFFSTFMSFGLGHAVLLCSPAFWQRLRYCIWRHSLQRPLVFQNF